VRWRSLLVVVLLVLGGGLTAWFMAHRADSLPLSPTGGSAPEAREGRASETLESEPSLFRLRSAERAPAPRETASSSAGGLSLRGRVLDERDQPVQAFELECFPHGGGESVKQQVASDRGEFVVAGLAPGSWWIRVRAPVLQMRDPSQWIALPHEPIEVHMVGAACITGIVLDLTGAPVADARVEQLLIRNGAAWVQSELTCDADGRFRCESLDPGVHGFRAKADEGGAPSETVVRTLVPGIDPQEVRLLLSHGGTIEGRILGESVDRSRERSVKLCRGMTSLFESALQDAECDESGRFRFEHVPPGAWWVLAEGKGPGGAVFLTAQCTVRDSETTHVTLGQGREDSVLVKGRLLRRGEPAPGASVLVLLDGTPAFESARFAEADDEGRYQVLLNGCGAATFLVSDHHFELDAPAVHQRIPCQREFTLDLTLARAGVRGIVVNKAGQPVARENVWVMPAEGPRLVMFQADSLVRGRSDTNTDEQGRFEFPDLAPGEYVLLAGGGILDNPFGETGRTQLRVKIRPEEVLEGLVLRLPDAGKVRGIIRDAAGRPCARLNVYARTATGELLQALRLCHSNDKGIFCCRGLAPGRYTFFARDEAQELTGRGPVATRESAPVDVQASADDDEPSGFAVVLVADPAGFLRVSVLDGRDVTLPAQLRVLDDLGREVGGVLGKGELDDTFERGSFGHRSRFGPLPPGRYTLEARIEGGDVTTQAFTLAGEAEKTLTIRVD